MKFKLIFILLLSFTFSNVFSQNDRILTGKLLDSLTSEPLAFASVWADAISQTPLTKGSIADEKGSFEIVGLRKDKYIIKVEYVGYKTKFIEVDASKEIQRLDLGAITLSPLSQLLESITVSGLNPDVVATIEKQVYKAEQFEVAKGGTATDALRNIPSVAVNAEGEITVRGSKGFMVMVNGKPSQVDAATLLAQIPANSIDKIEMITAPSAKYDADGKAGIINIVTKRGVNNGFSIASNMQVGLPRIEEYYNASEPKRYGADATINYKKGSWDASFSVNYLKNDIAGRRIGDVNTTINNIFTSFPSEGERSFKRENFGLRFVTFYKVGKNDEISAGIYLGEKTQYRTADIYYQNTKTDLLTKKVIGVAQYFNPNLVLKSGDFKVFNLDYTHIFKNASTLTLSGLYEKANLDGFTKNRNLNNYDFRDTLQYTLNTGYNPLNAIRLKADYEKIIGIGKFALGYQYRNQNQEGGFIYREKSGSFESFVINPAFSAEISVFNKIHALYSQYAGKYNRTEFSAGLRYEDAFREFTESSGAEPTILKLSNLFPSANFLYDLGKELRVKFAYSRRVQRSTNNELNPYPEREHSETLEQGDPNIRPEFIGIYEAGITKDLKKTSFYLNVYSQLITDIVNRVNSVRNDTILNRIYTNAGNARLIGTELGSTYSPFKQLKIFVGGNVYNLKIKGNLFDKSVTVDSKGWVYSINSNISYQILPSLSIQLNVTYLSARNTAQGSDSRFYQPNFSMKKGFKENKINLTLQWQNAALGKMAVNQQRISTLGANFYTTTNYIQETNIFLLNLSINLNQTTKKMKLPSSEFGEKEY